MYSGARFPIKRRKFLGSFAGRRRRGREGGVADTKRVGQGFTLDAILFFRSRARLNVVQPVLRQGKGTWTFF